MVNKKKLKVIIDRPLGSKHPEHNLIYELNYGYIPNVFAPDGEEQDVYVIDVKKPIKKCKGRIIAIIKRLDDIEEKYVLATKNKKYSSEEIGKLVDFAEKYFKIEIELIDM